MLPGVHNFVSALGAFSLFGCPELVSRCCELGRDRLHVGDEAVEGGAQAEILADRLLLPVRPDVLDEAVGIVLSGRLGLLAEIRLDLVVRDLDPGSLGERLERELARDRDRGLEHHLPLELLAAASAGGEVGLERDAAALERAHESGEEVGRRAIG